MSSSSNSRTVETGRTEVGACGCSPVRRRLLRLFAAIPFLASPAASFSVPFDREPLNGLRRWGSGQYRRFGFLVYEAALWAGDDPQLPPYALRLDYKRDIAGAAIAKASVSEMRRFGGDEASLMRWGPQMARLFPDVAPGDHIIGLHVGTGARFLYNGRFLGEIAEPAFAQRFFAIWLDPRTSAPDLRAALLKLPDA